VEIKLSLRKIPANDIEIAVDMHTNSENDLPACFQELVISKPGIELKFNTMSIHD